MKKIISMLLMVVMLLTSLPVFASKADSEKMQEVLLLVKEKITVPEEMTEFSGNVSDYRGRVTYFFDWTSADYEKSMSVTCDDQGRITSYHQNTAKISEKRLSNISKAELIAFAEEFLKTTVPEAFVSETDLLVYDEESYYTAGNLMYNIGFQRQKDDVLVKDNYANVYLSVVDEEILVRSMDCHIVYDAEFADAVQDVEDYQGKYQELFPVELLYRDEYQPLAKGEESRFVPALVYRIKDDNAGFMDAATGEIVYEDAWEDETLKAPEAEDSTVNMGVAGGGSSLTPQEMEELRQVEGLLSYQEIEQAVRKLPYIEFSNQLELSSNDLYKDSQGNYYFWLHYSYEEEDSYQYFSIRANAKTGEIIELSNHIGPYQEETPLTETQRRTGEKKITEFLTAVAKEKLEETEKKDGSDYGKTLTEHYVRMVHGVPYIDNGIWIHFDVKNNMVRNYSLNFIDGDFANPKDAIGATTAYEKILEYAPIQPIYIKCEGVYQKVFTLSKKFVSVDALTGADMNQEINRNYAYDDVQGHWVEGAATKLAEIQVGLPGGKLEPENNISQEEFLRLFASAVMGPYGDSTTEEFYDRLIRNGIVTEEEKTPESPVKREDSFVFIIRMAGYERIAKVPDIFQISYADQAALSQEKLGYAAILSGLGVVCGDGGNLRPQDALTRAEAIALTYQYLLSL